MKTTVVQSYPIWLPQTQTWMYSQVKHLPEDVACHVVCESTQHLDQFEVPNIHCLEDEPRFRALLDKGSRKLGLRRHLHFPIRVAREQLAQILHSHFGNVGWRDLPVARMAGLRHVVTFYGLDVNWLPSYQPVWKKRYLELFNEVDVVLCEGSFMARSIVGLGCPEEKVRVHHLGVDTERIPFAYRTWERGSPLRVLIAASFREKKGIPYALEALGRLQREIPIEITIIGDSNNSPEGRREKTKILQVIENHKLGSRTRMLGYQPHSVLLQEAFDHHLFLSPSITASDGDTEGGAPVSLIEMAATGMPVVSTKHCDIPEVVVNGVTGYLAGERDAQGLVEQIMRLAEAPETWRDLAVAARKHVELEYNARTQGKKLHWIYQNLAA